MWRTKKCAQNKAQDNVHCGYDNYYCYVFFLLQLLLYILITESLT